MILESRADWEAWLSQWGDQHRVHVARHPGGVRAPPGRREASCD